MKSIDLAEGVSLPIDACTQTFLVVGKRGSGKSNTCVRMAEQFAKVNVPFVAIDPTDTWFGMKVSADGKSPGLPVYIFGGRHADLPLEATAGSLIADAVIDHRLSAVLSIKHFSTRERARFVSEFSDRLFRRNTEPLHVFLEEAHEVAPQNPMSGEEEMLGRITRIWKLGRSSGLGGSAITQRPASLSKNITTQAEVLIVHRLLGPQDVKAVKDWIKYHGDSEDILGQLSTLKTGEAFLWAPDFPEHAPLGLRRVKIKHRETYDSSFTPKAGQHRAEPKNFAPVDLDALREKMAATIERAKAEDPKELREQIARMRREMAQASAPLPQIEKVEIPIIDEKLAQDMARAVETHYQFVKDTKFAMTEQADKILAALSTVGASISDGIAQARRAPSATGRNPATKAWETRRGQNGSVSAPTRPATARSEARTHTHKGAKGDPATGVPTRPQQKILDSLAWLESVRIPSAKRAQLALLAEASPTSSAFSNNLGALRTGGLIDYPSEGRVNLTQDGRAMANATETPPTAEAMQASLLGRLSNPQGKILRALIEEYPEPIRRDELAQAADASPTSSAFSNNLGTLRSLGLIDYRPGGQVVALPILFLEGE